MKGKSYPKEFKEMVLKEANECNSVAQVAKHHGLSTRLIYSWRSRAKHKDWQSAGNTAKQITAYTPPAKEFKLLETENNTLKSLLGEKDLEIAILRDLVKKANLGYQTR